MTGSLLSSCVWSAGNREKSDDGADEAHISSVKVIEQEIKCTGRAEEGLERI